MSKLLLVRHGTTEFNNTGRLAGYSDIEMNADGYKQAERLRNRLANEKIDAVYSSDLKRALVTAEVISSRREVDIVACPELREINHGHAEGLTGDEFRQRYPDLAKSYAANFSLQFQFPGGESFEEFFERTGRFIERLKKHAPSETILVVSHNGPLRLLICYLLGIELEHWQRFSCANASLSIVETFRQRVTLSLLNDTSHLRDVG